MGLANTASTGVIIPSEMKRTRTADKLVAAAALLRDALHDLRFRKPVEYVYHPLEYAWAPHEAYLRQYGQGNKRVLLLGMNPGPFGMMQVGVPFGAIPRVRDWLAITGAVTSPARTHPKRPVLGFACHRVEVSGDRFWSLMEEQFGTPTAFFAEHFVVNYCPLAFLESSGRNRTPDKLPAAEKEPLFSACDEHLRTVVQVLQPEWIVGVGRFAEERAHEALPGSGLKIGCILHPGPANPAANRPPGWGHTAARQLRELGVPTFQ